MAPQETTGNAVAPTLLDQIHARIGVKHYSIRTEAQYVRWIKRFAFFCGKVEAFLSGLAVNGLMVRRP